MNTNYLDGWDAKKEQQKAEFMEHVYRCSGRTNGLYTGLWQEFCLIEAGPHCRDEFFARLQFIEDLNSGKLQEQPGFYFTPTVTITE
jgi:hypothetical protein